jgi:hypothetical protein
MQPKGAQPLEVRLYTTNRYYDGLGANALSVRVEDSVEAVSTPSRA